MLTLLDGSRLFSRHRWMALAGALMLCAGVAQAAGPTGLLNDTGQTQCDNGSNVMAACTVATTGDAATYKRQDGRFGRDVASPAKVGGGVAGFDFTRICWNGDAEGSGTCTGTLVANTTGGASGTPTTDWACTRDNVTNLIWSLQTQSATWDQATVGTYPDAGHNSVSRCGFATGWRLPTLHELLGIMVLDGRNPAVDTGYFPSTQRIYWASEAYASNASNAWTVAFDGISVNGADSTTASHSIRLVRSGP
jgi:hypothetical protein